MRRDRPDHDDETLDDKTLDDETLDDETLDDAEPGVGEVFDPDPQAAYEAIPDEEFDEEQWAEYWEQVYADPRFVGGSRRPPEPLPVARRMSANGSVMAAMALGFREVFDPHREKAEIIVQRDDSGDGDDPEKAFHLDFDPEDPRATRATVRPWARDDGDGDGGDRLG